MARLIAKASGNFTSASTWGVVSSIFAVDSEAATTNISTSALTTPNLQPGAVTVDGVALKLSNRSTSPVGTFTVTLRNVTGITDLTSVTVNVSDLPYYQPGWVFFKFSANQTLLAATNYAIKVRCSSTGSQVTLYRTSTANDYSRLLRTTTTAAPAAGDQIIISKEYTGAGASNAITVTMDNTASTVFGSTSYQDSVCVSGGATLTWGTSNSTNYLLTVAGSLKVWSSSTWNQGTSGTRIPSSSTATLKFSVASNVNSGFITKEYATVNMYGQTVKTDNTLLTSDIGGYCTTNGTAVTAVAGQSFVGLTGTIVINSVSYTISSVTDATHLTLTGSAGVQSSPVVYTHAGTANILRVASTAGWSAGNVIAIAGTNKGTSDNESATILSVDSSTQVTLTAALTKSHYGTSPFQAEVIHLTRNVVFIGTSLTLGAYFLSAATATINHSYVEFSFIGSSTTNKRGIDVLTTSGAYTAIGCTVHDSNSTSSAAWVITGTPNVTGVSITYSHVYNMRGSHFYYAPGGSGICTIDHCIGISNSSGAIFTISTYTNITLTNSTAVGCAGSIGISITGTAGSSLGGTYSNLTSHSNVFNFSLNNVMNGTFTNLTSWRSTSSSYSILFNGVYNTIFNTITCLGNATQITLQFVDNCTLNDCTIASDYLTTASYAMTVNTNSGINYFNRAILGKTTSVTFPHSNADVVISGGVFSKFVFRDSYFGSATTLGNTTFINTSYILSQRHNQTNGLHKRIERYGVATIDTTTYRTSSPAETLTPSSSTTKFNSSKTMPIPIDSGQTATITVYVYKSASYNGNQPRLIVKENNAIGINQDTVIATATGGTGSWLALTGSPPAATATGAFECYVDCDGTAGTVTVDDWSVA